MIVLASLAVLAILLLLFLSPVAAYCTAEVLERIATELRHHGGAMAGAYATYRVVRRRLSQPGGALQQMRERAEKAEADTRRLDLMLGLIERDAIFVKREDDWHIHFDGDEGWWFRDARDVMVPAASGRAAIDGAAIAAEGKAE